MKTFDVKKSLIPAAVAAILASAPALGEKADKENPYLKPNNSWISISGTVVNPKADRFTLDYGSGMITVEMDDWDAYGEAYGLMDGDQVKVYGRVDDDLFEVASIEAGSVYVKNLNTFFHANDADEEDLILPHSTITIVSAPILPSETTMTGTVKKVDAKNQFFVMDMAGIDIKVETNNLAYNPLDDMGFQQIDPGDRVSVTGSLDYEFMEGQIFKADFVTTVDDKTNS